MKKFDVQFTGDKAVLKKLGDFGGKRATERTKKMLTVVGKEMKAAAQKNVSRPPPGHPQKRSGDLYRSIKYKTKLSKTVATVVVFTNLNYGMYLEIGFTSTLTGVKVGPYPWLGPAFTEVVIKNASKRRWNF